MKFIKKQPPRKFSVGIEKSITLKDCGKIFLDYNEQVTFIRKDGKEHDFTAKSWGFYATPSVNGRLKSFNLKTALIRNSFKKYFIVVVDPKKMNDFENYLNSEKLILVEWLDERDE